MSKKEIDTEQLKHWQTELNEEIASINAKVKPLMERSRLLYEKLGAINRLLNLSEGKRSGAEESSQSELPHFESHGNTAVQEFTPTNAYWLPILEALAEMGGSGPSDEVISRVGQKMEGILTEADFAVLPSGQDIRWCNRVAWQRYNMVKQGLLKRDSPRGMWELTERGHAELLKRKRNSKVHMVGIKKD